MSILNKIIDGLNNCSFNGNTVHERTTNKKKLKSGEGKVRLGIRRDTGPRATWKGFCVDIFNLFHLFSKYKNKEITFFLP